MTLSLTILNTLYSYWLFFFPKWHNVKGECEVFPEESRRLFERIRKAAGGEEQISDYTMNETRADLGKILCWAVPL